MWKSVMTEILLYLFYKRNVSWTQTLLLKYKSYNITKPT